MVASFEPHVISMVTGWLLIGYSFRFGLLSDWFYRKTFNHPEPEFQITALSLLEGSFSRLVVAAEDNIALR